MSAICSNNPARSKRLMVQSNSIRPDSGHGRLPQQLHFTFLCFLDQGFMEQRPADSDSSACGKFSRYLPITFDKSNSPESISHATGQLHA
jgi:hypothetical protein